MAATVYRPYTSGQRKTPLQQLAGNRPRPLSRSLPGGGGLGPGEQQRVPGPGGAPTYGPRQIDAGSPNVTIDYRSPQTDPNNPAAGGTTAGAAGPYANDPVYQQLVALANKSEDAARADALAQQKDLAINLGDASVIGQGFGTGTGDAAQANPFSILKNLLRGHNTADLGINQGTNKANLFYSSTRGRDLQNEGTNYAGGQAAAYQSAHQQLTAIARALLEAINAAELQKTNAAGDAYGRTVTGTGSPDAQALALYQLQNIGNATKREQTSALSLPTIARLLSGKGGGI